MNSESESYHHQPSTTTTAGTQNDLSANSHNEKHKLSNSTPNGYSKSSTVSNHKIKDDQSQQKKNDSEHSKHKDSNSLKHSHTSSHSKHKDDSSKTSSHKSSDPTKRDHHHHHDKHKSKEGSNHSEHSKHMKNDVDKIKSGEKSHKEHKSDKSKDEKHKEKSKEGHHSSDHKIKDKHKDHDKVKKPDGIKDSDHEKSKDKTEKSKDKSSDKHKEKSKDKSSDKSKDKLGDKPKEKSGEKSKEKLDEKLKSKTDDKSKDKHKIDKPKDKSGEKLKEKSDKPKEKTELKSGEKIKVKTDKPKDVIKDKIKKEREDSPEKKAKEISGIVIKKEREGSPAKKSTEAKDDSDFRTDSRQDNAAVLRVKQENVSQRKSYAESPDEDDEFITEKNTNKMGKRIKEESDYEDEFASNVKSKSKKQKAEASKKRKKADSDFEEERKKPAKKKKEMKREQGGEPTASPRKRGKKEEEQDVWKWWEEDKKEDGVKWNTLQHWGPVFAPAYERVPSNVKFYYDGKHMQLSEETEEVAGFYGRMLDHEYTTKDVFNTNFFKDWRKVMTAEEKEKIKDLKKCNFNAFNDYYKMKSEERKNMTKEEKAEIKKQNEKLTEQYGFCIIDGHKQKIGNFKIEPPGLFRGRGEHPKMGMLKRRVQPEDVSINIGKEAKVPEPPAGHKWKKVLHDNKVTWLASWNENILNSTKYIMLNPSSKLKGEKDWQKYETARKLKNYAGQIRETYSADFKSKEMKVRQRAVALYFIDKLALRAGNEKDEDTADTVGCCSLRVEHITLHEEKDGKEYVVDFDFLGKDSIRYQNSVPVEKRAFKNLNLFMEGKQPGDDLFDRLNTSILNKYLNELMEGLTAKVFRTYNASKTLQEQLDLLTQEDMSVPEKILAYNRANRAVAVLCNHQRSIPKTFSKSMENLKNKMSDKLQQIKEVKKEVKQAKADAKNSGSAKDKITLEKKKKKLQQLEEQLKKLEVEATDKEENKQIALGTSKLNYLDPRISVAWCKKWGVPIEKIYNKTQRDKFRWAIEMAGPDFQF